MQTVIREACGTYAGLKAHILSDEQPCSECTQQEAYRQIAVEGIPHRLPPAYNKQQEVTADEGERHREVLAEAIRAGRRNG